MPGGDGTGPMGMGPMSGWGAGSCAGAGVRPRIGLGRRAMLRCSRPAGETEQVLLRNQAELLQARLDEVKERLSRREKAD